MNKISYTIIALAMLTPTLTKANDVPKDTMKVVDMEEVLIIGTPKETHKMRQLPFASTLLSQQDMQTKQVTSIKGLTGTVPNLFIPDYGSKLTSAIYIRGIGSRINTSSVGLYVDNIPCIDKSAFDFSYADIERIDVLRGPQGTLYGRNTMGGLIKVHTKSPFTYQGTDLRISAASYGNYNASVTHYHRVSNQFAFSAGGFYEHSDGFFKNSFNDKKVDYINAGGGRLRGIYLPTRNWKLDLNVSYEYSNQGGYPYFYLGATNPAREGHSQNIGTISNNEESNYYRHLLNAGLNIDHDGTNSDFHSATGFQFLRDRMFIDQDFLSDSIYNLEQKQNQKTITEEVTFKSKKGSRWDWVCGAFGFYQWQNTNAPITFEKGGVQMIQSLMSSAMSGSKMQIKLTDPTMLIPGDFDTPTFGAALFHQSTYNNLLFDGLSATIGLRLDYENTKINYNSSASMGYSMYMDDKHLMDGTQTSTFVGSTSNGYWQLLPKFALQYAFDTKNNVYASVSRGYRSGGYNIQMFSDLIQNQLKKPGAVAPSSDEVAQSIVYKPEYTWNYEIGSHLTLWDGKLWADLSGFYMSTNDQQIAKFAESGLGRRTINAGKSHSLGGEIALRAVLTDALSMNVSYGYTYATFKDYVTNTKVNNQLVDISYNGNYVPFVPKHTLDAGVQYIIQLAPKKLLDRIQLNANCNAAGRIYWTEDNNKELASQPFYATLNVRASFEKGKGAIAFWARNILDKSYQTFYFESMGNRFMQKGRPFQIGVDVRCRF